MSPDQPAPTPEGTLIRRLRESRIPRLSMREAADRIGMSEENWGHVERGYQPTGKGRPPRRVVPPDATLAAMASAVGATPERLEDIGRHDAADLLREMLRSAAGQSPDGPVSSHRQPYSDSRLEGSARHFEKMGLPPEDVELLVRVTARVLADRDARGREPNGSRRGALGGGSRS